MTLKTVSLTVTDVSLDDISTALVDGLSYDDIFEFIIGLDEAVADYHFTVRLRDHLIDSIKREDEDIKRMKENEDRYWSDNTRM